MALNGTMVGYFEGKKGLRQGDPMSPYLFVIAMEIMSRLMDEYTGNVKAFTFHPRCSKIKLTHLCFVDDLLLILAINLKSVNTIKKALHEFLYMSGLKANQRRVHFIVQVYLS